MRKIPLLIAIVSILLSVSCGKRVSEIANTIPDHAFMVASMHPKQIYEKGQISSLESITKNIENEMLRQVLKDPLKSGIDISEYVYVYMYFLHDNPVIGVTATLDHAEKFAEMAGDLIDDSDIEVRLHEGYSMITPDREEGAMAWNDDQVIFLLSPDEEHSAEAWQDELISLYELEKENAVTSIVDFVDFSGKMKDMNIWFTGDQLKEILEKTGALDEMDFQLPIELYNNYGQLFVEFADGAMFVSSETHFSDDVTKMAASMMVAKEELNADLLNLAPGHDLLMALAFSIKIDNLTDLVQGMSPPKLDGMSDQIEQATGVPGDDILEALSGDFVIAVNGAAENAAMPVEVLIGIGLDDNSIQEKMMGSVEGMVDVEKEGEFFSINANGIEIYSGIVDGIWIITNTAGYKDAIGDKGLESTLADSKFNEYADGSMGMYMNLDMNSYPAPLQSMLAQDGTPAILKMFTESFSHLGVEASNKENMMTLKTTNNDENSLYTLLQIIEKASAMNE